MANVKAVTAADFQKNVIEVSGVSIVDFGHRGVVIVSI